MSIAEESLPLDLELSKILERVDRSRAEKAERERQRATEAVSEPKQSAVVIQLPLWPEPARGVPNDILRSALFAAIQGKGRQYLQKQLIAAYDGIQIKYTGQQLEQSDLDVWEQLLHLARHHPLGTVCHFTAHAFLKSLGRSIGRANYQWLDSALLRLSSCTVEFCKQKQVYGRGMI